ncbi:hypothetical protein BO78DRAFT_5302 [Aspergillus sclerotiicarbonarius CBS 121057]|uniref:Uncharacterized protein n=1 Tax=Aspergillus sclerotiicarbonarius (strain CBS 121057 / IBT 28362) TaxID=1448318 RepID=A0A319F840_ASPSB|nr:hypothetical protein BO78DRAFT_5302 [Aspergillus sclerotiicarbonarius CBS 121057]
MFPMVMMSKPRKRLAKETAACREEVECRYNILVRCLRPGRVEEAGSRPVAFRWGDEAATSGGEREGDPMAPTNEDRTGQDRTRQDQAQAQAENQRRDYTSVRMRPHGRDARATSGSTQPPASKAGERFLSYTCQRRPRSQLQGGPNGKERTQARPPRSLLLHPAICPLRFRSIHSPTGALLSARGRLFLSSTWSRQGARLLASPSMIPSPSALTVAQSGNAKQSSNPPGFTGFNFTIHHTGWVRLSLSS